jgi:hypothetical protein
MIFWAPEETPEQNSPFIRLEGAVGWGEAHHSWRERMTLIYPVIRELKIMCFIVHETQSMIHCTEIPHGFAKGGLHPTLQELPHL